MAPLPSAMEEQLIAKAVQEDLTWDKLPKRLKLFLGSNEEWLKHVKQHCIKKRLRWSTSPARNACREGEYYEDMLAYLKKQQAPFPYHLADYVCRFMRISPFRYYCDLLYEAMRNERSYDTIPNFTAADALRETGIGRNQFIDIMNKTRSKLMWKINRAIVKEMLPSQAVDFALEMDWRVCTVNLTAEEHRKLTEEELAVVEKCAADGGALVGDFDVEMLRCLYRKGFVYFDVPVYPHDHFQVRSLEGFVSNRNQQHEDHTEELLYALFVASSEQSTVEEQAGTLQEDLPELQAAISLACRLGWAHRVLDYDNLLEGGGGGADVDMPTVDPVLLPGEQSVAASTDSSGALRVAFMVDANLTSFLMMGSFSHSLKQQAVTLYEAGKLGDRSVRDLCEDLRAVENTVLEGELQQFADHAASLRYALVCLRTGKIPPATAGEGSESPRATVEGLPLLDVGPTDLLQDGRSPSGVDFVESNNVLNDSLEGGGQWEGGWAQPIGRDEGESSQALPLVDSTLSADGLDDEDVWGPMNSAAEAGPSGGIVDGGEPLIRLPERTESQSSVGEASSSAVKSKGSSRRGKNRVEVVRCESLAGLPHDTLQRLLRRDYTMVVSMVPLSIPLSIVSPDGTGPVHFGPPLPAAITPWMKLLLYTAAGSGPVTVALVRSQRLRQLPPPLAGCWKALVWSWDGSSVGGVGSKGEGSLVEGNILLYVINQLLRISAVLVQPVPYGSVSLTGTEGLPATVAVPLPLPTRSKSDSKANAESLATLSENSFSETLPIFKESVQLSDHPVVQKVVEELGLRTVGFLRMVRADSESSAISQDSQTSEWLPYSLELGIPLFDTALCQQVCEGALAEHIFDVSALEEQRALLANLRKRLFNFIGEYRAAGRVPRATFRAQRRMASTAQSNWSRARTILRALDMVTPRRTVHDLPNHRGPALRHRHRHTKSEAAVTVDKLSELRLWGRKSMESVPWGEDDDEPEDPLDRLGNNEREDDPESQVPLPGINLLFDGTFLVPFNLAAFVQGRLPAVLVAEAGPL